MVWNILVIVGAIELVSHFLGYSQSATIMLVKTTVTKVHDLVQMVLPKGK